MSFARHNSYWTFGNGVSVEHAVGWLYLFNRYDVFFSNNVYAHVYDTVTTDTEFGVWVLLILPQVSAL